MDSRDAGAMNEAVREAWNANAGWWDDTIGGEGNAFHRTVVAPAQMRLLDLRAGESVLDIACGNGQFTREMAPVVAKVVAFDFSEAFVERARQRTAASGITNIEYRIIDATNEQQLLTLGERAFDAAVCAMSLMDMASVDPLFGALATLLRPGGRFVFSILHPCFNSGGCRMLAEMEDRDGELVETYAIKVVSYLDTAPGRRGVGIPGQPQPQLYFDRTISDLFNACFRAGFVLDGLAEPAFPQGTRSEHVFAWSNYPTIPPVLVARMRIQA